MFIIAFTTFIFSLYIYKELLYSGSKVVYKVALARCQRVIGLPPDGVGAVCSSLALAAFAWRRSDAAAGRDGPEAASAKPRQQGEDQQESQNFCRVHGCHGASFCRWESAMIQF